MAAGFAPRRLLGRGTLAWVLGGLVASSLTTAQAHALPSAAAVEPATSAASGVTQSRGPSRSRIAVRAPELVSVGREVVVRATVRPVRPGRRIRLAADRGGSWRVVTSALQGQTAAVVLRVTPRAAETLRLRVTAARTFSDRFTATRPALLRVAAEREWAPPLRVAVNETVSQISDDGRWIALNSYDPAYFRPGEHVGSGRAALYDRATRKTRRLSRWTTVPGMSSVSSDGSRVAYVEMVPRASGRFRQVWVWDRATGTSRLRSATPHLGESDEPDLSGTGRHLVHTYDNKSWREVHHVDLASGRLTRLTGPGEQWETFTPLVSDDGRTVVMRARERPRVTGYPRWPAETVFVWRQDTGYVDLFPADRFGADQVQLSRDGRFLSYVRGLSDSYVDRPLVQPPEAGSYHHDLRTGRRTKIFEIAERPVRGTISGDGRFVFHSLPWPPRPGGACVDDGGHPGCLVRYDSVTEEITRVPGTLRFPSSISSDGRGTQITYTTDTWDLPEDRPLRGFVVTQTLPEPSLVD